MVNTIHLPYIFKPFTCNNLIRLGKEYDGGYLVNELDVKRTNSLIGFGVGYDLSFEEDFYKINSCEVNLYDREVYTSANKDFNIVKGYVIDDIPITEIFANKNKVFLKCDIEGGEYLLCDYLINNSHLFTGVSIEFHDIHIYENFNKLTNFISKFRLPLIHFHVNNAFYIKVGDEKILPSVVELSFSSSDNLFYNDQIKLPHKLDMRNLIHDIDFNITFD